MEQDAKSLTDYLAVLRRRRRALLLPGALVLLAGAGLAFGLPPVYRSTATILIEHQEIPEDLVRSTVSTYADQRIQVITERVMSRANLLSILERHRPYRDAAGQAGSEALLARMREDIQLETMSADTFDPRSRRPAEITFAFTVSYDNENPRIARAIADELAALYLAENVKSRTETAAGASAFLADESTRLRTRIATLEERLAEFKERHAGSLPEQMEVNLQIIERTERSLLEIDRQIRALAERRGYLESQLARLSPNATAYSLDGEQVVSVESRLRALRAQYASKAGIYSADHPDVIRLRKEIEALEASTGASAATGALASRVESLESELATLRRRYSDEHPDVRRLVRAIEAARAELEAARARGGGEAGSAEEAPDNPAWVQIKAQLTAAESELAALRDSRREVVAKIAALEQRLANAPQVEREYRALTRDYQNALDEYRDLREKQTQAELAETMEVERKGERFTLVGEPQVPSEPVEPNRIAIAFLSLVASVGAGIGSAAIAEGLDHTVRDPRTVERILGKPPLARVPYIETRRDRLRQATWRVGAAVAVIVLLVVGFVVASRYVSLPFTV